MNSFIPRLFIKSVVNFIDSFKVVLVLYPNNFLALLDEQDASLTSFGLGSVKIGSPLNLVSFDTNFDNSNKFTVSSSGPTFIISLEIFLSSASFSKQNIFHYQEIHICVHKTAICIFWATNNWLTSDVKRGIY